jgi:hypothetical protein
MAPISPSNSKATAGGITRSTSLEVIGSIGGRGKDQAGSQGEGNREPAHSVMNYE